MQLETHDKASLLNNFPGYTKDFKMIRWQEYFLRALKKKNPEAHHQASWERITRGQQCKYILSGAKNAN